MDRGQSTPQRSSDRRPLVAYLRVSTETQAERGFGLAVQEASVRSYVGTTGRRVSSWCRDEGISGTKDASERPGLTGALSAIRTGEVSGLVVARLDRLARTLTVQEAVLAQVWRYGGAMFSADVGEILADDPDDPMRTFVRQVMGAAAQLDRATTVSRLRAGRREKAEQGGYAGGRPPFGWSAVDGRLEPLEDEQATIRRVSELRGCGASLRAIGATLAAEGREPRSGTWSPAQLRRVLARAEGRELPARRAPSWAVAE
jgi:DNA invertase Pin-like site-specific DNA recombinase